jgi:hypothetical protein
LYPLNSKFVAKVWSYYCHQSFGKGLVHNTIINSKGFCKQISFCKMKTDWTMHFLKHLCWEGNNWKSIFIFYRNKSWHKLVQILLYLRKCDLHLNGYNLKILAIIWHILLLCKLWVQEETYFSFHTWKIFVL